MSEKIFKGIGITASIVAILGIIFTAGATYNSFKQLEDEFKAIKHQNKLYEDALKKHLGVNWLSDPDINKSHPDAIEFNQAKIISTESWISSIRAWSAQQDSLIRKNRLDKFRATAIYSKKSSMNTFQIKINKQHPKGKDYQIDDLVLIENPNPPNNAVRVSVKGFTHDLDNADVLVQINYSLLKELGLSTRGGRYELFVTNDPQVLRWKSLDEIHREKVAQD